MRKILIIMGRYLPGYKDGGPVRSIKNLTDRLGTEYDFHILTADRDHGDTEPYENIKVREWNQVGQAKVYYVEPGGFDEQTVESLAREMDMIYMCGCFNDYARTTLKLNREDRIKCKLVIAAMGLFSPGAFRIKYPKKKAYVTLLKALGYFENVEWSATDAGEAEDIRREVWKKAICHLAEDLPRKAVLTEHHTQSDSGNLRVVFLSRISRKKNLLLAIQILQNITDSIEFDIYGTQEDLQYWHECERELRKLPPNVKWTFRGEVAGESVIEVFAQYDIFLFPTMAENFGHVILEALLGGCIPVISDKTPWTEEKMGHMGNAIPLITDGGCIEQFCAVIKQYIQMDRQSLQNRADAAQLFAMHYQADEESYRKIFDEK